MVSPANELDVLRQKCAELETQLKIIEAASRKNPGQHDASVLFTAIQHTQMPMILTDPHQPDNPIIFANKAFVEFSGYTPDELIGKNCRFLQGEDTSPETMKRIRDAISNRQNITIDIVNYHKDGQRFINELYISPVFDSDGKLIYFFGSQVNVTAYIKTRMSLELRSVERERHVLSQIARGLPLTQVLDDLILGVEAQSQSSLKASILFVDADGQHLSHGSAPSLPKIYIDAINGIAIKEGVGACGTAASRGTPVYTSDIATDPLWKDHRDLVLPHGLRACWSTPIKAADGTLLGTFATYYADLRSPTEEDMAAMELVTQTAALAIERHHHDLRLQHSEDRLRVTNQALETANLALEQRVASTSQDLAQAWRLSQELLVMALPNGTIENVNPTWTHLLGWTADELVQVSFVKFVHPDDLAATKAAFAKILKEPLVTPHECRFRHRDGTYRWFGWTAAFEDGTVYASGRQLTVEKEQAEALRQSQKMEAIGQLTGGVAHDFNNLLTVIKSSTELLKRPGLPEDRRARYVTAIATTVDRAAKLTGQLLAFARRQALKPEVFAACDSVRAITDMMITLTGARIEIVTHFPKEKCMVNADPSQFDTALVNMALNARDAMDGQGRLTIRVEAVEVMPAMRSQVRLEGPFVAISLTDTGSGIPSDRLEQVFEPFYTTKGVGKGTGLGLSQVFGFAKQSGGEVMVKSEVGQGSTFTLYLPRVDCPEPTETIDEVEPLIEGHGMYVLVVEDNIDVGTFAVQTLADLGYKTVLALNAEEALAELEKNADRFDVVFSDVVMPGMNGVELGHEIRRRHHDLPVLLASGYSHVLAQNGTYGFELLHKPYSIEQLSRLLRKVATWQRRKRIIGT
jgi:PAS domain S-box-containing protein